MELDINTNIATIEKAIARFNNVRLIGDEMYADIEKRTGGMWSGWYTGEVVFTDAKTERRRSETQRDIESRFPGGVNTVGVVNLNWYETLEALVNEIKRYDTI